MTIQEIEDYINTYRVYPDEYQGKRDVALLQDMQSHYYVDLETMMVTRIEGRIDENGDFKKFGYFTFPLGKPEEKVRNHIYDMKHAVDGFNRLMTIFGCEDRIIAPGKNDHWNLRDMVSEVEHLKNLHYDPESERYKIRYEFETHKDFDRYIEKLRFFIRKYRNDIADIVVTEPHGSKYDNL